MREARPHGHPASPRFTAPAATMRYAFCYPMLLENDPAYTGLLLEAFGSVGVPPSQIRTFADGTAAVSALDAAALETRPPMKALPSFLLLDHHVPGRSGLELLEWMRQTPALADLPVFMLSANTKPDVMIRALELRARSCFVKPATFGELQAILEAVLAHWYRRSRGPL